MPKITQFSYCHISIPKSGRTVNQDNFHVSHDPDSIRVNAGVYDGVGSEQGHLASQAAQAIIPKTLDEVKQITSNDMYAAVFNVHKELVRSGMRSATTASFISANSEGETLVANTGDSRVYKFDGKNLFMLTIDDKKTNWIKIIKDNNLYSTSPFSSDDLKEATVPLDKLTPELLTELLSTNLKVLTTDELQQCLGRQIDTSNFVCEEPTGSANRAHVIANIANQYLSALSNSNVITNCISTSKLPSLVVTETSIEPGDILFLCTDGLYGLFTTRQMEEIFAQSKGDCQQILKTLSEKREEILRDKPNIFPSPTDDDATGLLIKAE